MDIAIYQGFNFRAEDGAQTRDPQLGRLMLYQLSYFRKISLKFCGIIRLHSANSSKLDLPSFAR